MFSTRKKCVQAISITLVNLDLESSIHHWIHGTLVEYMVDVKCSGVYIEPANVINFLCV